MCLLFPCKCLYIIQLDVWYIAVAIIKNFELKSGGGILFLHSVERVFPDRSWDVSYESTDMNHSPGVFNVFVKCATEFHLAVGMRTYISFFPFANDEKELKGILRTLIDTNDACNTQNG